MPHQLRVRMLGRLAFEAEGEPLRCTSRKALLLAACAVLSGEALPRAKLASLVWGSGSPRHALGSLRVALTKLPDAILAVLDVARDSIGVARDARIAVDADAFLALARSADSGERLAALVLYGGDLLEGAEEEAAPELGDWLFPRRARLRDAAREAHARAAQELHAAGERARAREVADAWLRREPACEALHRLLMTWLPSDEALAQYETYRRARAVLHGAAPSDEMAAHADRLRRGAERALREPTARLGAATSFMGRTDELSELRTLLADPSCRLLTVHGLGGVGKTRLANAIVELERPSFGGGVHVAALESLDSCAWFGDTLARACGLHPSGERPALDLVAGFLGGQSALIVLDNLEHLLGEDAAGAGSIASQVARLLRATGPGVKILATSREPLRLQEEWVYELEGLAFPKASDDPVGAPAFASVQFFAQRARQAYVGFSLEAEAPSVARICELLEGLPLGLELAASWVRNVPCAEIAASLAERAGELRTRHVDRAARHGSLAAVVAYSWERLSAEQRDALSGLAVLRGTFSREAAESVAHAGLRTLTSLFDKALLQRAPGGRWHMHEVVRQFAWERPDEAPRSRSARQSASVRQRDACFTQLLAAARAELAGAGEADALTAIMTDLDNIRAAWSSCARCANLQALEAAAVPWFDFLWLHRYSAEGREAARAWLDAALARSDARSAGLARVHLANFEQLCGELGTALDHADRAVAALEAIGSQRELALAVLEQAAELSHLGRLVEAERSGDRAIALAQSLDDPDLLALCLTVQGFIVIRLGKGAEARALQRRALEIVERLARPSAIGRVLNNLALADNFLGSYGAAEAGYERAQSIWKELGAARLAGLATHNLGVVAQRMGDYAKALERYRIALEAFQRSGDRKMIGINLMSTGDSLVRLGRAGEACGPLQEALAIGRQDSHALVIAYARAMMAHAQVELGNPGAAAGELLQAIEEASRGQLREVLAECVVNAARLVDAALPSRKEEACAWLRALRSLHETPARVRDDAKRLGERLDSGDPGAGGEAAASLDELVAAAANAARLLSVAQPASTARLS